MTSRRGPSGDVYNSARLAAGYAFARPPVHEHVVRLIAERLGITPASRRRRGLDVGCGAGRSAAALRPVAVATVGLEPAAAMLAHHRAVAPSARFVVGRAESLPFPEGTFDLVTCAGALNYTDVTRALAEIARVLAAAGTLVVYDFSAGRRSDAADLDGWFAEFEGRYPFPAGYALDVPALDYDGTGLRFDAYETCEVRIPMTLDSYLAYVLSETNVQRAVTAGTPEDAIQRWCRATLEPLFGGRRLVVRFDAYIALITRPRLEQRGARR